MQLHEINDMTTTDKTEQITTNNNNNNNNKNYINNDKNISYINNDIKNNNNNNNIDDNSPSTSINSNNVSIVSLDENDDASSVVTDSDDNSDIEDAIVNFTNNLTIDNIRNFNNSDNNDSIIHEKGLIIINQQVERNHSNNDVAATSTTKPSFGSVAVQNSSDVTFGNKTFYQGPVTIKQFLLDNNKWRPSENCIDNPTFPQNNITGNNNVNNCIINTTNADGITPTNKGFKEIIIGYKRIGLIITFSILFAVMSITTIVYLVNSSSATSIRENRLGDGDKSEKNSPLDTNLEHDLITQGTALRMISRDEWIAQPPAHELEPLELPVKYVIFAHTVTDNCSTQAICILRVRLMQTFHMESRLWDDIGYNFLIGGDGAIYEGRGWDKQGAHTKGYNSGSLGIAFIGTFNTNLPPERQLQAAKNLLEEGVRLKKLSPDYKMYGHRQLIGSESPGKTLFELLKTWPHWSNDIPTS